MRDGEAFEGETALDVVRAVKGAALFTGFTDVLAYIGDVQQRLRRVEGIELRLTGEKIDERCEAFVRELDRVGLAKLEELAGADLDEVERMVRETEKLRKAGALPGVWKALRKRGPLTKGELREVRRRLALGKANTGEGAGCGEG